MLLEKKQPKTIFGIRKILSGGQLKPLPGLIKIPVGSESVSIAHTETIFSVCLPLISRFPEPLNRFDRIFANTSTRQ